MVLGYGGFWGLSSKWYRSELHTRTTQNLRKQEIVKLRRMVSCSYVLCGGIVTAALTAGGSLIAVGISGRKIVVADRKLGLIRDELKARGFAPHELEFKDIWIPFCAVVFSMALVAGAEAGVEELVHLVEAATGGPSNTSSSLQVTSLDALPPAAVEAQAAAASPACGPPGQGPLAAESGIAIHNAPDNNTCGGASSPDTVRQVVSVDQAQLQHAMAAAAAEGPPHEGFGAFRLEEAELGELLVVYQAEAWVSEALEAADHRQRARKHLGCARLFGATSTLRCDACREDIESGYYMHCCRCNYDNYDICARCHDLGARCMCPGAPAPKLHRLQVAFNGSADSEHCRAAKRRRDDLRGVDGTIRCDVCHSSIHQGRYFACFECHPSNSFDICLGCYKRGNGCTSSAHVLYTFMWASPPPSAGALGAKYPYYSALGGGAKCDRCWKDCFQGTFYHCSACKSSLSGHTGHFDVCHACYETTGGCGHDKHTLTAFPAFRTSAKRAVPKGSFCDAAGCHRRFRVGDVIYSCSRCVGVTAGGQRGSISICQACYGREYGCKERSHAMERIVVGHSSG